MMTRQDRIHLLKSDQDILSPRRAKHIVDNLTRQGYDQKYIIEYLTSVIETMSYLDSGKDITEALDFHVEATRYLTPSL